MRFSRDPEQAAVTIGATWKVSFHQFEAELILVVEDLVCYPAAWVAVHQHQRFRVVPLHAHHGNNAIWHDATDTAIGLEFF